MRLLHSSCFFLFSRKFAADKPAEPQYIFANLLDVYTAAFCSKHRTPNDKHPLFFPSHPLDNLLRRFGHDLSTRPFARNAVKLVLSGFPTQRDRVSSASIVDLEMGGLVVDGRVQSRVQRDQAAVGHERGKVGVERGSEELDVGAGFVDEVEEG